MKLYQLHKRMMILVMMQFWQLGINFEDENSPRETLKAYLLENY